MTKIQLRRDTAANWSTNNPTPSAGEPCFETDTGKLKIGDGITTYNSLPYQGGTSDTAVTTDTAQIISGQKTFENDIVISQWNSNLSPVRETHIDLSTNNGNAFISAAGVDKSFGMYCANDNGIQLGTSKFDYTQGLSVRHSSLTFKSSDGIVTDLLARGSGTGDVTSAGNNTFTGFNIFKGKSLNVGDDNSYAEVASFSGATYTVGDQEGTTIFNPVELGASFTNTVLKSNVMILETDTTSATKKAYSIMTKSAKNNEYMAHMAMPSNKYVDLELGASNTTYTAPADGYFELEKISNSTLVEDFKYITLRNNSSKIEFQLNGNYQFVLSASLPVKRGDTVLVEYNATGATNSFKFVYAVGSEPQS